MPLHKQQDVEAFRSSYYAYDNGQIHAPAVLPPTRAGGEKGWEGLRRWPKKKILHKPINLVSSINYYNSFGKSDMPLVLDLLNFFLIYCYETPLRRFLEKLVLTQLVEKFPTSKEPAGSYPFPQQTANEMHTEPD